MGIQARIVPLVCLSLGFQIALGDAPETAGRPIFRCKQADVTVFSDRPCDTHAEIYRTERPLFSPEPPRPAARSAVASVAPSPKREPPDGASARDKAKHAERCHRMQLSLQEIRSKMRSGYTAKEGTRLRAQRSKLEEQRRFAKCS